MCVTGGHRNAIDKILGLRRAAAVDAQVRVVARLLLRAIHVRREQGESQWIAIVLRQFLNSPVVNHQACLSIIDAQQRSFRRDAHRFGLLADFHHQIDADPIADAQFDSLAVQRAKARKRRIEAVCAGQETRQ